eukprot:255978-Lingulodinium_polyedra.AAC.1
MMPVSRRSGLPSGGGLEEAASRPAGAEVRLPRPKRITSTAAPKPPIKPIVSDRTATAATVTARATKGAAGQAGQLGAAAAPGQETFTAAQVSCDWAGVGHLGHGGHELERKKPVARIARPTESHSRTAAGRP